MVADPAFADAVQRFLEREGEGIDHYVGTTSRSAALSGKTNPDAQRRGAGLSWAHRRQRMKTLSGLDATFLYLETPETPMHVGSLHLYELPRGFRGSFHKAVQAHIAKRMHLAPIFHRRLAFMPLEPGAPGLVEADAVNPNHHIRKARGGRLTVQQVQAEAARLHGVLIDRSRPLWEFHIFENVAPPDGMAVQGKLVAFYSKVHHAALDGKGGTVLANAILDLSATPREVPPPDPARRRRTAVLKIGEMIGAIFSNSLTQYAKLAAPCPRPPVPSAAPWRASRSRVAAQQPHRPAAAFAHCTGAAHDVQHRHHARAGVRHRQPAVCGMQSHGQSRGRLVQRHRAVAVFHGAAEPHPAQHGSIPRKPLIAAMPVSLREENNKELNNQASMSLVDLGTQYAHPMKRMNAIMASTAKVKQALVSLKSVLPTDYPSLLAPWIVGKAARAALKTYGRSGFAERLPMVANLAISNVPGPQVPLYLAGARMLTFHPLSIVMTGAGVEHHHPDLCRQRGLRRDCRPW